MCINEDLMSDKVTLKCALYFLFCASSLKDINLQVMNFSNIKAALVHRWISGHEVHARASVRLGFIERDDSLVLIRGFAKAEYLQKLGF